MSTSLNSPTEELSEQEDWLGSKLNPTNECLHLPTNELGKQEVWLGSELNPASVITARCDHRSSEPAEAPGCSEAEAASGEVEGIVLEEEEMACCCCC